MANPSPENGHIDIANELVEVLMKVNLYPYQYRVLWVIWRKTYGWHKESDFISLTQFERLCRLDRRNLYRTIKELEGMNMIIVTRVRGKNLYRFNMNYDQWNIKCSVKKDAGVNSDCREVSVRTPNAVSLNTHTNVEGNKETIQKKDKYLKIIFDYYCQKIKKLRIWDKKRKDMIRSRLKKWTVDDLKQAIDGVAKSKWHMENGQNSFELIFRNDKQVEKYVNLYERINKVGGNYARFKNYNERSYSQEEWQKISDGFYQKEM